MNHDRSASSGFTGNGNVARITTKLANVGLYPLHGKVLVTNTSIDHTVTAELIGSKEAKGAQTVLNGNTNKVIAVSVDELGEVVLSVT